MSTLLPAPSTTPLNPATDTDALSTTLFDLELDLFLCTDAETEEFPYLFQTSSRGASGGQYLPLRSWTHLEQMLAEVLAHGAVDHLILQHAHHQLRWAQTKPHAPGRLRVELSDGAGWVNHFASSHRDHAWSSEQALWILRGFVTQRHVRVDGTVEPVPRRDPLPAQRSVRGGARSPQR